MIGADCCSPQLVTSDLDFIHICMRLEGGSVCGEFSDQCIDPTNDILINEFPTYVIKMNKFPPNDILHMNSQRQGPQMRSSNDKVPGYSTIKIHKTHLGFHFLATFSKN